MYHSYFTSVKMFLLLHLSYFLNATDNIDRHYLPQKKIAQP